MTKKYRVYYRYANEVGGGEMTVSATDKLHAAVVAQKELAQGGHTINVIVATERIIGDDELPWKKVVRTLTQIDQDEYDELIAKVSKLRKQEK